MFEFVQTVQRFWDGMNLLVRLDMGALAILLVGLVLLVTRVSYRYRAARREAFPEMNAEFWRVRRKLVADLGRDVRVIKSIAVVAPYLGLAGCCFGILNIFVGISMSRASVLAWEMGNIASAPTTTAAGLIVAAFATVAHNFFRTRVEALQGEIPDDRRGWKSRCVGIAQTLPLAPRFSGGSYALVAAPSVLATLLSIYLGVPQVHPATGYYGIKPAEARCRFDQGERIVVLHVTNSKLFLNLEEETWTGLRGRLSDIYYARLNRVVYLLADDDVDYQTVMDAIDIVRSAPIPKRPEKNEIEIRLITPAVTNTPCPDRGLDPEVRLNAGRLKR